MAVAPGAGDSLFVGGGVTKLVADPHRCLLYALNTGDPSELLVIDTSTKTELTRVAFAQRADDLDLSPGGGWLVVSHDAAHSLSVIDPAAWTVSTMPTVSDPFDIEVDDTGRVFYVELDQWVAIRRIGLRSGPRSDALISGIPGLPSNYRAAIKLSPNGALLYVGDSGGSSELRKYEVLTGALVKADASAWKSSRFSYAERHVYLSPNGRHVYYAGYQLDSQNLARVNGQTSEKVFAEDLAGTFAVGSRRVFDAETLRVIGTLPHRADAAALLADRELWYYNAASARLHFQNVDDFRAGFAPGARALPARPLSTYHFMKLVHDPTRGRLYGLDAERHSVVFIDTASLEATTEIVVGPGPSSLSVDPFGRTLFIGHEGVLAMARIDLASAAFDGFLTTPVEPAEVLALSYRRVAFNSRQAWQMLALVDGSTGATLESTRALCSGALTTTAAGNFLFVGEVGCFGAGAPNLYKFDISRGRLTLVKRSGSFPGPDQLAVALPDGSGVYYGGNLLDGAELRVKYAQPDPVQSVTPDGKLALSARAVFSVSDGRRLGWLPLTGAVQAVSRDSRTLFVAVDGGIASIDLTVF